MEEWKRKKKLLAFGFNYTLGSRGGPGMTRRVQKKLEAATSFRDVSV